MKKIFVLLLAVTLTLNLAACGTPKEAADEAEFTLPAVFFDGMTEEEIQSDAKEDGYKSCVVHEDGSVTYTLSHEKQEELLLEYKGRINDLIKELVGSQNSEFDAISKIEYNKDVTEFRIYVNWDKYTSRDHMISTNFFISGGLYQLIAGVDEKKIDVVVNYVDEESGEILDTLSLREDMYSPDGNMAP